MHGFHFVVLCITDRSGSVDVVFGLKTVYHNPYAASYIQN